MHDDPCTPVAQGAVLLAERLAASPSPRGEQELEEETLLKEWIDPAYLRLVQLVSSPRRPQLHVEGLRLLASLCRRALPHPLTMQPNAVAECEFAGIATLCRAEEAAGEGKWPYSRETTLKWFVLLEALTVIHRFRRHGKTVIQIQLGKRETPSQAQLLSNLDDSAKQYTNRKTVELLLRAKADLQRYGIPSCDLVEGDLLEQEALQRIQRHLVAKLQESGVSRATSRKVALSLTSGSLAQLAKDYLHAVWAATSKAISLPGGHAAPAGAMPGSQIGAEPSDSAEPSLLSPRRFFDDEEAPFKRSRDASARLVSFSGNGDCEESRGEQRGGDRRLPAQQGDFLSQKPARTGHYESAQGDSPTQEYPQPETLSAVSVFGSRLGIHQGDIERRERPEEAVSSPARGTPSGPNRLERDLLSARQGDSQRAESPATTAEPPARIALPCRQGDSGVVVSNSNSISFSTDPLRESKFEFDTTTPESPCRAVGLRTEATYLWRKLYSEEQRTAPGGKQLIGGLINKLNERPDLVRLAMVNVLMQRFFPDRHGPPDGCGAKWFYRSYGRYLSGELTPSPEIRSWAESPYSYEQIERALRAEYACQQADVFCKPHRPSASCIREHPLLSPVVGEAVGEERPECQATEHDGSPDALTSHQAGQRSLEPEELVPAEGACHPFEAHQAPALVHEPRMGARSSAKERQNEGYKQEVVMVEDSQTGWASLHEVLWWRERIESTPLVTSCRIEVLPTMYGRYVLVVTPHDDEAAAWLWSSGRQVRLTLEQWRTSRVQTYQPSRCSVRTQMGRSDPALGLEAQPILGAPAESALGVCGA